jgi:hypothetical protein
VCLDIDNLQGPTDPDGKPLGDHAAWVRYAVAQLPSPFQGAGYHYQWSNSAGVKGWSNLRLHLWFLLSRPVCGPSLKTYLAAQAAPVDLALCSAAQIHYTAAPLFRGHDGQPIPDPWAHLRCGLHDGPPVTLPAEVQDLAAYTAALDATGKNDISYVVTEYGVAQLRGKTAKQRAEALIGIAHPDFRGELRAEAKKMHLL